MKQKKYGSDLEECDDKLFDFLREFNCTIMYDEELKCVILVDKDTDCFKIIKGSYSEKY